MRKGHLFLAMLILTCSVAFGQTYKVLWTFGNSPSDGFSPRSNLIADNKGNLYGTTQYGGTSVVPYIGGTVFELSPQSDGTWSETILHNFCSEYSSGICLDGATPLAGLILDAQGNLYGTTYAGGNPQCGYGGCGIVFELAPPLVQGGMWSETVLYNFCSQPVQNTDNCLDGFWPASQLTFDSHGNLYGTTSYGGAHHELPINQTGVIFELSPGIAGWAETTLYSFCSLGTGDECLDGAYPLAGVTFDKSGNLFGTTAIGGHGSYHVAAGTVYELSPGTNGWTETVLLTIRLPNATFPQGAVTFDPLGNLYTTYAGGGLGYPGAVLRLDGSNHTEKVVQLAGAGGPGAGVIIDTRQSLLFGTSEANGAGYVFEVAEPGVEKILYSFCQQPDCSDGQLPTGSLLEDGDGNLYGTTMRGGANDDGVVFELTP
jgi:uncharacterized repeat protein (TIGR03803 family)